jgi:hypothetical protein
MSELQRLREASDDAFTRELLESARQDGSPHGAAQRALLAVGAASSPWPQVGAAHAEAAAPLAAGKAGIPLLVKWLGLAVLAGGALVAVLPASRGPAEPPATYSPSEVNIAVEPAPPARALPATPPVVEPELGAPRREPATAPARRAARSREPRPAVPAAPAASDDTLTQLAELRAVRAALVAGATQRALSLLDAFGARYPGSPLAEEASVLRIDALADQGRRADALALAQAFLRAHPHSAYAQRLRSKLSIE